MKSYEEFLASKHLQVEPAGIEPGELSPALFPHQRDLVRWALRKGRAAIFADTGLGKSLCELAWAQRIAQEGRVLILAPLAVAQQLVGEGRKFGIESTYARQDEGHRITVTNYEMLGHFDPAQFVGVVLDESSLLKAFNGKTRNALIEAFAATPFRLAATATPAPNDFTELGNHSEFLGVRSRVEMLAEFFVHDGGSTQNWRLKGHAVRAFWEWVASWGAIVRSPADLGHDASAFELPPLRMHEHVVPVEHRDAWSEGYLFAPQAQGLAEARAIRRATTAKRVALAASLVADDAPSVIWCELNTESEAATKAIPGAVEVRGSNSVEEKVERLEGFAAGRYRVMVTKASVAGFGLNWQHCARQVFLGASYSYEQTYQAIRRCWRFGQIRPVDVHIIRAEIEDHIIANYRRKEAAAERLAAEMTARVRDSVQAEVLGQTVPRWIDYQPRKRMEVPKWLKAA
jgi:superfamily II DNA or RNA helicase